ncbi:hypothetical protein HO133_000072 [Letharia lupina]|uniref:Uncharacterized protein n=1 Tax=Letharia lupina TaxID=560253 RepID=A0A8H6CGN1_9LECA|nr:uncharacterized protein HO133_000072 [Letharia lupina]KAF6223230.1 hypothetical protein HO133_000072 [Letharia lupina]
MVLYNDIEFLLMIEIDSDWIKETKRMCRKDIKRYAKFLELKERPKPLGKLALPVKLDVYSAVIQRGKHDVASQQAATFRASTGQTLGETKQATTSNDRPGQVERPKLSLRSLPYVYTDPEPLLCANEDKLQHDSMRREHSLILKAALPLTPATSSELPIRTTRDTSFDLPIRNHSGRLLELLAMQEQDRVPTWRTWVANRPGDLHVAEVKDRSQAREKQDAALPRWQCTHPIGPLL